MQVIKIENLSKRYYLGDTQLYSLRETLTGFLRPARRSADTNELWALRDVSFDVKDGETLGIIGRNGAGKSTLLKILSRITRPTSGTAEIRGRVGSLLEVGTGFHNELSGRENVYLNGAILGMKRIEIAKKFDEIVAFSEIEKFLDTPVKHYSSGMYMRLAFSIAAHLDPEVLIVDEVLAVGDIEFQKKCLGKMDEVSRSGRTVLFVSHNLGSLAQICKTGLLLEKGRIAAHGTIEEAIGHYLGSVEAQGHFKLDALDPKRGMQIVEAFITSNGGRNVTEVPHNENFFLEFRARAERLSRGALFCVALLNKYKERVFTEHKLIEELMPNDQGDLHIKFGIPANFVAPNDYSFLIQIFLPDGEIIHDLFDICPFTIVDTGSELSAYKDYGYVQFQGEWNVFK